MKKYCNAGGQALIEGIMMRNGDRTSIVVRRKDGSLVSKNDLIEKKPRFSKVPFVRGAFALVSAMVEGIKALNFSAKYYEEDYEIDAKEDKFDAFLKKIFKDKYQEAAMTLSLVLAIGLAVGLFIVAPSLVVSLLRGVIKNQFVLALLEGIAKMGVFVAYVYMIGKMKDVARVFQYHGAEHKAIHCLEDSKELTVENVRKYSTLHPRCGTSFILFVLIISTLIFSFVSWNNMFLRISLKLLFLPLIAGISYEVLKLTGNNDNKLVDILAKPGLWMQRLTTNEPDDSQLEVAIVALRNVIENQDGVSSC